MKSIKIALKGSNAIMRRALARLLNDDEHIKIVTETSNSDLILQNLSNKEIDLILVDTNPRDGDESDDLKKIFRNYPEIKVILLGLQPEKIDKTIYQQIHSFVLKNEEPEILFKAIHSAISTEYLFTKSVYTRRNRSKNNNKTNYSYELLSLNEKETEILKYICDGKTNKEIATLFQLSPATVDFHRTKIYGKTKSNNITDLFRYAIKRGIVVI